MKRINIKVFFILSLLVASSVTGIWAQEGTKSISARETLLSEATKLLDKIEQEAPSSYTDLVKVRERLFAIYNTPVVETVHSAQASQFPEINFARQESTTSVSRKRKAQNVAFYNSVKNLRGDDLVAQLHNAIKNNQAYTYSDARKKVMLEIDKHGNSIECVYTGKIIPANEMPDSKLMNIEHTWPQSKGATGIAKSDMHHLFPTDPVANSRRSSLPFGDVDRPNWEKGGSACDGDRFEVREQHRGNAARAIFYFSVRYGKKISASEEKELRDWHKEDPVDANEIARNDRVEAIQGNRNPFVDHPEFVDLISDF
jgi:deoxyribonuclease-1